MRTKPSPAQAGGSNRLRADTVGLEAVLEALYDLYRHRDINSLPARILSVVTKLIACDGALYIRIDPATTSFSLTSWPADTFASVDHSRVAELHLRDHPVVAHFSVRRDARAWMLHDFIPRATFQNTMLYRTISLRCSCCCEYGTLCVLLLYAFVRMPDWPVTAHVVNANVASLTAFLSTDM